MSGSGSSKRKGVALPPVAAAAAPAAAPPPPPPAPTPESVQEGAESAGSREARSRKRSKGRRSLILTEGGLGIPQNQGLEQKKSLLG